MRALLGKVALVTGGGSEIGRAAVFALVEQGAKVVVADSYLHLVRDTVAKAGPHAVAAVGDVTNEQDVSAWIDTAESLGELGIAVNAAGLMPRSTSHSAPEAETFGQIMRLNVYGSWLCMNAELRAMLRRTKGSIVNVASLPGWGSIPLLLAAKHAVIELSRAAAAEHANSGIRINTLCPGLSSVSPKISRAASALSDLTTADQVAEAIVYLGSDAAAYTTGTVLPTVAAIDD